MLNRTAAARDEARSQIQTSIAYALAANTRNAPHPGWEANRRTQTLQKGDGSRAHAVFFRDRRAEHWWRPVRALTMPLGSPSNARTGFSATSRAPPLLVSPGPLHWANVEPKAYGSYARAAQPQLTPHPPLIRRHQLGLGVVHSCAASRSRWPRNSWGRCSGDVGGRPTAPAGRIHGAGRRALLPEPIFIGRAYAVG